MTSKQRAYLKGLAMTMDPILQIGKSSLTPEITQAVAEALAARELIKIHVLKNCMEDGKELPFKNLDYIFLPGIRKAVEEKADIIEAYVVEPGGLKAFELRLGELTDEERQIILKGCLINYNRVG